ncbi:MAG: hypothetical protein AB9869_17800 [Verrucomicrobiia bacterium]
MRVKRSERSPDEPDGEPIHLSRDVLWLLEQQAREYGKTVPETIEMLIVSSIEDCPGHLGEAGIRKWGRIMDRLTSNCGIAFAMLSFAV